MVLSPKQTPIYSHGSHYKPKTPTIMKQIERLFLTGLCDVWGGRMWFCVTPDGKTSCHFWRKSECAAYIRNNFTGSGRELRLARLRATHGRAYMYA